MTNRLEMVMRCSLRGVLGAALAFTMAACGDSGDVPGSDAGGGSTGAIEVAGSWDDNWGTSAEITASVWGAYALISFDNDANWAVTQAAADDEWNPSQFSKTVWTEPAADGSFWTCTVAFGLATEDEALAAADTSDASDPATGGCSDFAWTRMFEPLGIKGSYETTFDESYDISSVAWGAQTIVEFDNSARWAITQNPADDEWNPSAFNRLVWTAPADDGAFWVCTVDFGLDTAEAAAASTNEADATDPENSGCGGFGWTGYSVPSA